MSEIRSFVRTLRDEVTRLSDKDQLLSLPGVGCMTTQACSIGGCYRYPHIGCPLAFHNVG